MWRRTKRTVQLPTWWQYVMDTSTRMSTSLCCYRRQCNCRCYCSEGQPSTSSVHLSSYETLTGSQTWFWPTMPVPRLGQRMYTLEPYPLVVSTV